MLQVRRRVSWPLHGGLWIGHANIWCAPSASWPVAVWLLLLCLVKSLNESCFFDLFWQLFQLVEICDTINWKILSSNFNDFTLSILLLPWKIIKKIPSACFHFINNMKFIFYDQILRSIIIIIQLSLIIVLIEVVEWLIAS